MSEEWDYGVVLVGAGLKPAHFQRGRQGGFKTRPYKRPNHDVHVIR